MSNRTGKQTTSTARALDSIADLHPGDHLCIIYHTDAEHRAILTEYLQRGLDAGERVVYIVDARTAEDIRGYLRDAGVDVTAAEERKQLEFLTRDDAYMREGRFEPQGMIKLLREETERALDAGFAGLRVTGEMSWALRGLPGSERLIEYETLLNTFFPGSKATALCQYDARHFPPDILLDVLRTHPIAVVGTTLYENPYYIPPEEHLTGDAEETRLNRWLSTLERIGHLNSVLKAIRNVNQLIVRERDPDRLINDACALLTETRGFSCAWIVLLDENGQPERWAGSLERDAVEKLASVWREEGPPHCAQKALNRAAPVVVDDIPSACPACPVALLYGPASGVAVRLEHEEHVYGILVVGVPSGLAADPEERDLLQEVAGDIAYALAMNAVARDQQELHTLLASTMESIQDGISILDRDLTIQHVNHAMRAWYAENEPLVGKKCYEVYQGRGKPCELCPSLRSVQTGRTESEVVPGIHGSSAEWLEVYSYPIKDPQSDTVMGVVEFVRDITERVRSQKAIQRSHHMLRIAGEMAKMGGWNVDLAENRVWWSDEVAAIHEMPAGFAPTVDEGIAFYAPKHRERIRKVFTACAQDGVPYDEELQIITGNGRRVWVRTIGEPVRDTQGEITGVQGAFQDITEKKTAEEELQESEERFRSLFEESPVALFEEDYSAVKREMDKLRAQGVTDLDAYFQEHPEAVQAWIEKIEFLTANRAAMELFGADSVEAMVGFTRDNALGPAAQAIRHEFVELFAGNTHVEHEGQARDLRGNTLETVVRMTVVAGHEERLDRVLVSIQDVTPQVRAKEAVARSLQQTRAMFEGAVHSLSTLAEMRDPYTAGHQRRVAELCCAIADKVGLPERQVEDIRIAGLLHDIGKSIVPAEILNKPTTLTDLEMSMIRSHPQASHDILKRLPFRKTVATVILQHHERLDGSGYPQGLTGEEILPEAKILAVADVVEAMASHRPYRPARGLNKALEEIQTHRGTHYDPDVVDACVELFAEGFAFSEDR